MKTYEGFLDIFNKKKYEYEHHPNGYSVLILKYKKLKHIPEYLLPFRNDLEYLNIEHNKINNIPKLPDGLRKLSCDNNLLTKMPELPISLKELDCADNNILELPKLPHGLQSLYCSRNKLKRLPELPSTLVILQCHSNDFEAPIKIEYFNKYFNKFFIGGRKSPFDFVSSCLDKVYTKEQIEKFSSYEFQKNFINEDNWKDLEPFGYADGIKDGEFSYLFNAIDMGLL